LLRNTAATSSQV
jgi:hypothetical protein